MNRVPEHFSIPTRAVPLHVAFGARGLVAVGQDDGTLSLLDLPTRAERHVHRITESTYCRIECLALSPDERLLAGSAEDGRVAVLDTLSGEPLFQYDPGDEYPTSGLAFSRDGRFLAVRSTTHLWLLDTARWQEQWRIEAAMRASLVRGAGDTFWCDRLEDTDYVVTQIALDGEVLRESPIASSLLAASPDGRWLAIDAGRGPVEVRSAETFAIHARLPNGHALAFSSAGDGWAMMTRARTLRWGCLGEDELRGEIPLVDAESSRPITGYALAFDAEGRLAWNAGKQLCVTTAPLDGPAARAG